MAFPDTTYTNPITALTALENKVAAMGMTSSVLPEIGFIHAFLANHLDAPVFQNKVGYQGGKSVGGTVTQATNKQTGVTLSKLTGKITMNAESLAAAAETSFAVTNTLVGADDIVLVIHSSGGTAGSYLVQANTIAAGSFAITVSNVSAGALAEAIVLTFVVLQGADD